MREEASLSFPRQFQRIGDGLHGELDVCPSPRRHRRLLRQNSADNLEQKQDASTQTLYQANAGN